MRFSFASILVAKDAGRTIRVRRAWELFLACIDVIGILDSCTRIAVGRRSDHSQILSLCFTYHLGVSSCDSMSTSLRTAEGSSRQFAAIAVAPDRGPLLRAMRGIPAAVIHGRQDPLVLLVHGEATAAAIADATMHIIDGMGHNLPPCAWEPIADIMRAVALRANPTSVALLAATTPPPPATMAASSVDAAASAAEAETQGGRSDSASLIVSSDDIVLSSA
jgi:pimeloyl-ACP methyl ester carboxylesterase